MTPKKKKSKKPSLWMFLASLLLFAAGAGIFLYPAVSNYLAEKEQRNVIHTYQAAVDGQKEEELKRAWKEAKLYNENLAGDPVHDPFVLGSGYALPENYDQVLNLNNDGVMGYVEIPKISVNIPIYHGTEEETLEKGAGHLEMTALPVGGKYRHSVISAHRGLPSAELFSRLDELELGDVFYIHVLTQTLAYEVDQIETILPEELGFLNPQKGKDLVTLLTCTPYAVNTHRLLVRGSRIPYKEAAETVKKEEAEEKESLWKQDFFRGTVAGFILVVTVLAAGIKRSGKKSKRKKEEGR